MFRSNACRADPHDVGERWNPGEVMETCEGAVTASSCDEEPSFLADGCGLGLAVAPFGRRDREVVDVQVVSRGIVHHEQEVQEGVEVFVGYRPVPREQLIAVGAYWTALDPSLQEVSIDF
jgi:hypothetical protein